MTHTYYLRPTGQSEHYSLQFLMHSKILGNFAPLDIIFTYYTNMLGGYVPTESINMQLGLFNDPRKLAVFRLLLLLFLRQRLRELPPSLGCLDLALVESFESPHGFA